MFPQIENGKFICNANQLTGFYMKVTFPLKKMIRDTKFYDDRS